MIINSSAHRMPLADGSVNCIVTSPPYFGLRAYAGNQLVDWPAGVYSPMAGVPACVEVPGYRDFDEYSHCEHEWSDESFVRRSNDSGKSAKQSSNAGANGRDVPSTVLYCSKCGAMRCGLGNEPTPEAYVWHMLLVMRECYRVLRDDGVMWFNIADSYADDTKWGGTTGGKHVQGLHGEPVGRARTKTGLTGGNLTLIPERILMAAQADGWTVRSIVTWWKSSTMPESVKGWRWEEKDGEMKLRRGAWRHTRATEPIYMLTKGMDYWCDSVVVQEAAADPERTNYKPGLRAYAEGNNPGQDDRTRRNHGFEKYADGETITSRNPRNFIRCATAQYKGSHYATFPPELITPLVKAATPRKVCPHCRQPWAPVVVEPNFDEQPKREGDRWEWRNGDRTSAGQAWQDWRDANPTQVKGYRPTCNCPAHEPIAGVALDPFAGSGTTGMVAREWGVKFIGLDISHEYLHDHAMIRAERAMPAKHIEALPLFAAEEQS